MGHNSAEAAVAVWCWTGTGLKARPKHIVAGCGDAAFDADTLSKASASLMAGGVTNEHAFNRAAQKNTDRPQPEDT